MKFNLKSNYILLESLEEEETDKGVVLPNKTGSKPSKGKVISVGPGRIDRHGNFLEINTKVGEVIHFKPFSADNITIKEREYLIVREDDVYLGI